MRASHGVQNNRRSARGHMGFTADPKRNEIDRREISSVRFGWKPIDPTGAAPVVKTP